MALGPVSEWTDAFNNLPLVGSGNAWAGNMANAVDGLTSSKLSLTNITGTPAQFTFGTSAFQTALESLSPTTDASQGAQNFADAWETAIQASMMVVSPGASVGAPSPATTFSIVASTTVDAGSLSSAKSTLVSTLAAIPPSGDANAFATAFRTAFLGLTYTTNGTNSSSPTPAPLVDANDPVI